MLDLEPWLNETIACTFPEPYSASSRLGGQHNFNDYDNSMSEAETGRKVKIDSDKVESLVSFKQYEGVFGNFAYGNITVNILQFSSQLHMNRKQKLVRYGYECNCTILCMPEVFFKPPKLVNSVNLNRSNVSDTNVSSRCLPIRLRAI